MIENCQCAPFVYDPTAEAMIRLRVARERLDEAMQDLRTLAATMERAVQELATILKEAKR